MKNTNLKVISIIIIIIGILLIYKGYTIQKNIALNNSNILSNKILLDNKITTNKAGLYRNKATYYFKGEVYNNYVKIFNRLYRIISITDKKVKIVSNVNEAVFYYGKSKDYKTSNINEWLNKTETPNSGIYYNTIPNVEKILVKTSYNINNYHDKLTPISTENAYFTILNIEDYLQAGSSKSYLNNGTASYILGYDDNTILEKTTTGNIKKINKTETSGIRVIMTLKKNMKVIKGNGTINNPYVISQKNNTNYINKYIQLGDDLYKVVEEQENILKLRKKKPLPEKKNFSNKLSGFNPLNKNNIAYYLNNTYYKSLSYKKLLKECTFYTSPIKTESNYADIYKSKISTKIGLLNMYDLNITDFLTDYYLVNTSSNDLETAYIYDKFGTIKEEKITTLNKIIPVICIDKNSIKKGTGTQKNPYIIE